MGLTDLFIFILFVAISVQVCLSVSLRGQGWAEFQWHGDTAPRDIRDTGDVVITALSHSHGQTRPLMDIHHQGLCKSGQRQDTLGNGIFK